MKTIKKTENKPVFQGDIMITKCAKLPDGAVPVTGPEANVVAHSETGHHHIVMGADVFKIPSDPLTLYCKATAKDVSFKHLRDWDTHETIKFKAEIGDIFPVRQQQEWSPEGWQKALD